MSHRHQQTGVALITALLVVALATTAAAFLASAHQLEIRRTGNIINTDQAYLYALGAEPWAKRILYEDARKTKIDTLNEDWATILPPLDIPGGVIAGYIADLQGSINLNSLMRNGQVNALTLDRLQRLFTYVAASPGSEQAVVDWIDPDVEPYGPTGAEDGYYLGLETPYRAANRPYVSTSELRLLRAMETEPYQRLVLGNVDEATGLAHPMLSALPADATSININTAPLGVFVALGLPEASAQAIIEARQQRPFNDVEEFLRRPEIQGTPLAEQKNQADLSVTSQYFLVYAEARIGRTRAPVFSVLQRDQNGIMRVITRTQGSY